MHENLFKLDALSFFFLLTIVAVGSCVWFFSRRYLLGEKYYNKFFTWLFILLISQIIFALSNHIFLFIGALGFTNYSLYRLMSCQQEWQAARESARLALRNFAIGFSFLLISAILFTSITDQLFISQIVNYSERSQLVWPLLFLIGGAIIQSALIPFHKWLLSSLNTQAPISALMHAGIVNGGGFILITFQPLLITNQILLDLIFFLGAISTILGSLIKLMQSDIKRMLAASTLAQMGFMMMEVGLGLFEAALIHLSFHGLFKAYQFLTTDEMVLKRNKNIFQNLSFSTNILSACLAIIGSLAFYAVYLVDFSTSNTHIFLLFVVWVALYQSLLPMLRTLSWQSILAALFLSITLAFSYAIFLSFIKAKLTLDENPFLMKVSSLHLIVLLLMLTGAFIFPILLSQFNQFQKSKLYEQIYFKLWRLSLPSSKTVTASRTSYSHR